MATPETTDISSGATPYGTRRRRWVGPVLFALLLMAFDEQGVIALPLGVFLILVYLPRSFLAEKYRVCRGERMIRLAIYLSAVAVVFGLAIFNASLAKERAAQIIAAAESFKAVNGKYPDRLDQLAPQFIPKIPSKAKLTLMDGGFRYFAEADGHTLMYVAMQPYLRRSYRFETKRWMGIPTNSATHSDESGHPFGA